MTPKKLFDDNPRLRYMSEVRIVIDGIDHQCGTMVIRAGDKIKFKVLTTPTIVRGDRDPSSQSAIYPDESEVELTAAKLWLKPFRPSTTTGTQAENYPISLRLPYIELEVPPGQNKTSNVALNATIRSLLHEQWSKFGSQPIDEVSLGFSTDCRVNDYCEAVNSIERAGMEHSQLVNHLQLGPRDHQGGPSLKSILSDQYLFRAGINSAITIKTDGPTGLSPHRGFEAVQDTPRLAHPGGSPTTVTIKMGYNQAQPDYKEVAALLHSQPRHNFRFTRRYQPRPMEEFTTAVNSEVDRLDRESSVRTS
jgi:hypothetical protein